MTKSTSGGCGQFETSPETIDPELRTAFCERRQTDRLKTNYSVDDDHSCARVCCIMFKGNKLKIVIDFCLQKLPDDHLDHVCGGAALRR